MIQRFKTFLYLLYGLIRRIKVRYRLLLTFFLVTLVPLFTITLATYQSSIDANLKTLENYSSSAMSQASNAINNNLVSLEDAAVRISYTRNVQQLLKEGNRGFIQGIMDDLEYEFLLDHSINHVVLYPISHKNCYSVYGTSVDGCHNLTRTFSDTVNRIRAEGGRTVYSSFLHKDSKNDNYPAGYIQLARPVYSKEDKTLLGYLILIFQESYLSSTYRQIDTISDSKTFIINSHNIIISSIGTKLTIGEPLPADGLLQNLKNDGYSKQPTFDFILDGREYITAYSPIVNTDLFVVSMMPKSYIYENNQKILYSFGILALLSFLLAFLASVIVSRSITLPLNRLMHKIENMKKAEPELYMDDAGDEPAILNNTFNEMVQTLNHANVQKEQALIDKHKMQLNVLQAQINPHFLVNTLNSVKWLATYQNAPNIEELCTALINTIRQTFGKDNERTTVEEEMQSLMDYSVIQAYRFMNDIQISAQADDEIKDLKIPRFLIQPLVENCYIHGFRDLQSQGQITVRAKPHGTDHILITVADNGTGLSAQKIERLLKGGDEEKSSGLTSFGVHNVNERIKLYYGSEFSLSITSEPYIYTVFEMILPRFIKEYSPGGILCIKS